MQYPDGEQQALLAERIAAGDRNAETELVNLFSPRVFAMLCARTRDRETARDLLHDAMLALLRALRNGQLRDSTKLAAFIHGTVKHILQAHGRSRPLREEALVNEPAVASCAEEVENTQRSELLRQAIAELEPIDQDILMRTLAHGQKPGLIARDLRLSPEAVRQRKLRATRKVAEFVKKSVTKAHPAATSPWRLQ